MHSPEHAPEVSGSFYGNLLVLSFARMTSVYLDL